MTAPAQSTYTCPYCRMNSDGTDRTCRHCGAPVDVRLKVTNSGWIEQPPIRDMARLRFSRSTVQISGAYVPVAEMGLNGDDWVYFSHHSLLHTDTDVKLDNLPLPIPALFNCDHAADFRQCALKIKLLVDP